MPNIIIDTREQKPLDFSPFLRGGVEWGVTSGTLLHGDYSVQGLTELITIERKSLPDFIACVGRERERFTRELLAMRGYKYRAVMLEFCITDLIKGKWRGVVTPSQALHSIASWRVRHNIEFIYASDEEGAASETFRLLKKFYDYCKDFSKIINI